MDKYEAFNSTLNSYINEKNDNNIFLIDGKCGTGKTFAIKNFEKEYNLKKHKNKEKFIYISLNGVVNIYDAFAIAEINSFIPVNALLSFFGSLFNVFCEHKPHFGKIKTISLKTILKKLRKTKVIVFDDIEKTKCDINDIVYITNLLQSNNIKIIYIVSQEEIKNKELFKFIQGKSIGHFIKWEPNNDIVNNIISQYINSNFSSENLMIFKSTLIKESEKFFKVYCENENYIEKRINFGLLIKTINYSSYIIKEINCTKKVNIENLYREIIRNVYVYFHKQTYMENIENHANLSIISSANIEKITLKFVDDYMENGYINIEKYKTIIELLRVNKHIEKPNYNQLISEECLNEKAMYIFENFHIFQIYCYQNILEFLNSIDYVLYTNYVEQVSSIMIKNIKKDDKMIYKLEEIDTTYKEDNVAEHIKENTEIFNKIIKIINIELKKHNEIIIKNCIEKYLNNPYEINDYLTIFENYNYTNGISIDELNASSCIKAIAMHIDNKTILDNLIKNGNTDIYFKYFELLKKRSSPPTRDINNDMNAIFKQWENSHSYKQDKSYRFYIDRKIEKLKVMKKG